MKKLLCICLATGLGCLLTPTVGLTGNGYMGGSGKLAVIEEPEPVPDDGEGGLPDDVEGPLNDNMADSGKLFGDLYKILRYTGGEAKMVPSGDGSSAPQNLVASPNAAIGGEPILSDGYGWYAKEVAEGVYEPALSNFLSQCVQPVADYDKWGDIGRPGNTLPLIMTYDATWGRTECAVGEIEEGKSITVNSDGTLNIPIDPWFIPVGGTWNGHTYCEGVLWTDMVEEVSFGRLNLSRSPEAVLQAAFDEAISAINAADSVAIDPAGRLLLTTTVYSETEMEVDADQCYVPVVETIVKAIDSPLENLALYVKLMKDGHLITPGDQRAPIDRSVSGGIPLWKMLELTDGPSTDLRPTLNIDKLKVLFPELVDVTPVDYVTYYDCFAGTVPVDDCTASEVDSRVLRAVAGTTCPVGETCVADHYTYVDDSLNVVTVTTCPAGETCTPVPWNGIITAVNPPVVAGKDFDFAAAFVAAAGDKTGAFSTDMVVYLNSILGINKVVGYSAYDDDGTPADGAIDYSLNPVYFNFSGVSGYDRGTALGARGSARYLQESETAGTWVDKLIPVKLIPDDDALSDFDELGLNPNDPDDGKPDYLPNFQLATENILGFTQMADDDLSVIEFIHTYQIPGLR